MCAQTIEVMCLDSPMLIVRVIEYTQAFWCTVISIGSDDALDILGRLVHSTTKLVNTE